MNKFKNMKMKKIRYLDGKRLRNAILASTTLISRMQNHLNKINVFPVADGDTGTNMAHTMKHIASRLFKLRDRSISEVSNELAKSALMGAQGNSGAILAQFFHGFAEGAKGKWRLTTSAFASAVQRAKQTSFEALSEPRDGTILTVIDDWANYIEDAATKTEDFVELLKKGLKRAKQSLADTPKKLEVLKKAGVVDAGAQGFVHILEGIVHFIEQGKLEKISALDEDKLSPESNVNVREIDSDIKFRFCTECMITAQEIDRSKLREALRTMGDSLIVAGGSERVRIHIHTNTPDTVFATSSAFGDILERKVDDMVIQHQSIYSEHKIGKIGIVTDSSCDLPDHFIEDNDIHIIPVKLIFGDEVYRDKVEISPVEFYEKLLTSPFHPTTSQPAVADALSIYEHAIQHYDEIISIHLPRASSGTLQTIEKAVQMSGSKNIHCIDGKGISAALGLVVMEAVQAVKDGLNVDQIKEKVLKATENVKIFIMLPTLKYLVKGGRVSKPKGLIGKILNLKPLVSFDSDGRVALISKAFNEKAALNKIVAMTKAHCRSYGRAKFIVAHANAYEKAQWCVEQLRSILNISDDIPIVEAAPVLGVHAGPGTVGIAVIGYDD